MFDLSWYYNLNSPPFSPPAWFFAPAWTFLYTTMFIALVIYATRPSVLNKSWGYTLFFAQIALNLCWPAVFFLIHNIGMAFAIIIILDIFVILNIVEFYKVAHSSAIILLPYLFWLIFATYLNAGYLILN